MKKALSAVLAVVLVLGVCFSVPMIASGADTEDLTFVLNDAGTGYIITDCDVDASGELVIPEKYAPEVNIADPVNANEAGGEATTYNVVIDDTLEKVTLSVDKATAAVDDTVTVTVVSVVDGYELTGIDVTDSAEASVNVIKVSDTEYTFVMPESNVDVTATYQEKVVVPETYTITGVTAIGGKVEANVTSAKEDDKVTLTVTETAGYRLKADTLKVNGGAVVLAEDKSFTMPAGNVTITAEFEKIVYTVAITDVGEIVGIHTDKTTTGATVGDTVTVLVTVAETYVLNELIIKDAAGEDVVFTPVTGKTGEYTFTMPASNVSITATYVYEELPVVGIADGAFEGCTRLTKITIGKNVATIGEEAFKGCTGLKAFDVATGNTAFAVDNVGVLYNLAKTKLIAAPYVLGDAEVTTEQTLTIPATVEEIAKGAFQTLGELDYVFGGKADLTVAANNDVLTATVLHKGMTTHTKDAGVKVDPTCKQAGQTTFKCKVCLIDMPEETITHDIVDTAHNMSDWTVVTDATCTQEGVKRKVCTNKDANGNSCDYYVTDIITKPAHEKSDKGVITTPAKCGVEGVETFYCKTCDYVFETKAVAALEHEITDNGTNENIIAKKDATCEEAGFVKGNCDHCSNVVTINYEKLTHNYIRVVDAEPTCTVNGWEHYACQYCGDYKVGSDMELKAPGHIAAAVKDKDGKFVDYKWTIVKAATCSEDGFAEVRCENCGIQMVDPEGEIEYTRVLPKTGKHEFKDYTETKAATCEETGEKTGTCACGATDVVEIDALGHDIKDVEFTIDTEATCKDNGSKSKHCKRCDKKLEVTVITEKGPHKLKEGATETTKATCHNTGLYTGECTVCGDKAATVVIPVLDHVWDDKAIDLKAPIQLVVDKVDEDGNVVLGTDGKPEKETITASVPTCTAAGYQAVYCKNEGCTAHKEDSVVKVDELGHNPVAYPTGVSASTKVNATCTSEGTDYRYCDRCKAEYSIKIPMLQHDWKTEAEVLRETIKIQVEQLDENGKVVLGKDGKPVMVEADASKPTCNDAGYTAIYCKTCATYKDVTAVGKLGHDALYKDWRAGDAATCMVKATETNTCSRCNETMTRETGDFAEHNFSTTKTTVYPTCEKDGVEYFACQTTHNGKQCEARSQEKVLDALGHDHGDNKLVGSEPTCEVPGVKTQACTRLFNADGSLYVAPSTDGNDTPSTGDSNANGDTGSVVADGDATATPVPCAGLTVTTPATGHAFSDDYEEDLAATCETAGKESRHCTNEGCKVTTGSRAIAKLGHNYSTEYKVVTAATCQAEGQEARYCLNKDCKSYTGERKLAKADHTYNDRTWKTVEGKAATCEKTGYEYNNCTVCNERAERESRALGHKWAETWTIVDADCVNKGQSYKACERAGCTAKSELEETPALGHKLRSTDDGYTKVDQTATNKCTVTGYEEGYCYVCNENNKNNLGKVSINVVESVGHKFDETPETVQATCVEKGSVTGKCSICGLSNVSNEIPAKGHTFGEWEMRKDDSGDQLFDSCKTEDSMVRYCTVKNCNGYEYGENTAHTESGWILDADATCSTNGKMHTECTVCKSEIKTQTLYATEAHEYEEDTTKRVEPTCIEPGSKTLVCKNCKTEKTETIKATDHTFTEWKVFVEPTCTEKGIRQSVCTVCLTTKSEKILALGHDLGADVITAPTCTVAGSKHQECSRCDYKTTATPIAALGHNYTTSNTCSAEGCEAKLYEYKLIGESTTDIEITKYNGNDANLVIPAEIDGYIVKAIGERAFMKIEVVKGAEATETTPAGQDTTKCEKSTIETVTIPETVTTIGAYAFASASDKFKSVVIPGTVTTIGDYAFGYNATITWVEDTEAQVEQGAVRPLKETISAAQVADFAIYGVKDSAAAVYAAQDAKNANDDFKFAAIADIYEVAIPEEFTEVAEKSSDNVVLFKDFVEYAADATNKKSIAEQIAAVVDINVSGYSVEVVASQSYKADENATPVNFYGTGTKVLVKEGNNVVDVIEIAVQGDVNGDGVCDAIDCMLIQLAAQNQKALSGVYLTAGDYDGNAKVGVDDFSGAVNQIFGEDRVVEEPTTEPTTQAPSTTEPTTQKVEENTPDENTPDENTPDENTPDENTPDENTPAQAS